jgi:hypothetical protein
MVFDLNMRVEGYRYKPIAIRVWVLRVSGMV